MRWLEEMILAVAKHINERRHWKTMFTTSAPKYEDLCDQLQDLTEQNRILQNMFNQKVSMIQDQVFKAILGLPHGGNRNTFIRTKHIERLQEDLHVRSRDQGDTEERQNDD